MNESIVEIIPLFIAREILLNIIKINIWSMVLIVRIDLSPFQQVLANNNINC